DLCIRTVRCSSGAFRSDGFRFDATDAIHDKSDEYIIGAVGRAARKTADPRSIILIAENERQVTKLIRPRSEGGDDLDAVWNDDFHHSADRKITRLNSSHSQSSY